MQSSRLVRLCQVWRGRGRPSELRWGEGGRVVTDEAGVMIGSFRHVEASLIRAFL